MSKKTDLKEKEKKKLNCERKSNHSFIFHLFFSFFFCKEGLCEKYHFYFSENHLHFITRKYSKKYFSKSKLYFQQIAFLMWGASHRSRCFFNASPLASHYAGLFCDKYILAHSYIQHAYTSIYTYTYTLVFFVLYSFPNKRDLICE